MADARFFTNTGPYSAEAIANAVGARLVLAGGGEINSVKEFYDVAPLQTATARDIGFLDNVKYVQHFEQSKAGGCLIHEKYIDKAPKGMLLFVCDEPYSAYASVAAMFYPPCHSTAGISPAAHISKDAVIGEDVTIGAGAVIEAGAKIGSHTCIGANCVIGASVEIGTYCDIGANSTISHSIVGNSVIIHRGVNIGQDGFGFAPGKKGILKVPQLGRVIIEDYVDIGSGTCIDRGAGPDTIIGAHTKIDNLVQIGHNVQIGKYCFFAGQVGIAGSCIIEDGVMMGGQAGIAGHLRIGKGAKIAAQSGIMNDIGAGEIYNGSPAFPQREYFRQLATLRKLATKGSSNE